MTLARDLAARHEREQRLDRFGAGRIAVVANLARIGSGHAQKSIAGAIDVDLVAIDDGHGLRRCRRGERDQSDCQASPQVYFRTSSITLPSLGRLPGAANSTLPPTLQTIRIVPSIAFSRSGDGVGASTLSVMMSAWFTQSITRRRRPRPGYFFEISAICSGSTNMPRTFVRWSARPIQPLMRMLVRPHGLGPASTADMSPVPKRISG